MELPHITDLIISNNYIDIVDFVFQFLNFVLIMMLVKQWRLIGAICIGLFLVSHFSHYMNILHTSSRSHYLIVRQRTLNMCSVLWWPNEIKQFGPLVNISPPEVIDMSCTRNPRAKQIRQLYMEKKRQFMNYVERLKKITFPAIPHNIIPVDVEKQDGQVGHFQPIDYTRGYVLSAFLDNRARPSVVKILYMIPIESPDLYCHAFCNGTYIYVKGSREHLTSANIFRQCLWHEYILHCHFPECLVAFVSVASSICLWPTNTLKVISIDSESKPQNKLGACLKQIYKATKNDLLLIVHFFETFLHFGGDTVYLYGTYQVDSTVMSVLHYYERLGVLTIYDWHIPSYVTSLYLSAQHLSNIDCNYRHMKYVDFLMFTDYDEVIYPLVHDNYSELLQHTFRQKYSALLVNRFLISPKFLNYKQSRTLTEPDICFQKQSKPLGKPKFILSVGIHTIKSSVIPFRVGKTSHTGVVCILHFSNRNCSPNKIGGNITQLFKFTKTLLPNITSKSENVCLKYG